MKVTKITRAYWAILIDDPYFTGIVEDMHGDRCWFKRGHIHREDGPAFEVGNGDGYMFWSIKGARYYNEAEWQNALLSYKMRRIVND